MLHSNMVCQYLCLLVTTDKNCRHDRDAIFEAGDSCGSYSLRSRARTDLGTDPGHNPVHCRSTR